MVFPSTIMPTISSNKMIRITNPVGSVTANASNNSLTASPTKTSTMIVTDSIINPVIIFIVSYNLLMFNQLLPHTLSPKECALALVTAESGKHVESFSHMKTITSTMGTSKPYRSIGLGHVHSLLRRERV